MIHRSAEATRAANITYHLVPTQVWAGIGDSDWYTPEAFDQDGFIHCTNGLDELVAVGNLFYTTDPRDFTVLVLNVPAIASEVRYDDDGEVYPHIYGPLNTSSVLGELQVSRSDDGRFVSIG